MDNLVLIKAPFYFLFYDSVSSIFSTEIYYMINLSKKRRNPCTVIKDEWNELTYIKKLMTNFYV
jgi:hypothetical protein